MIYPQSFPSADASYAKEEMYALLSKLEENKYASFYCTVLDAGKVKKMIPDFIVVNQELGLMIVDTKNDSYHEAQHGNKSYLQVIQKYLIAEFDKLELDTRPCITTGIWGKEQDKRRFGAWFESHFDKQQVPIPEEDFEKIKRYLKRANMYYTPPGKLQRFYFRNFNGIKKTEIDKLPIKAPWIFLTGENGFGKTSILQAIALSLYGSGPERRLNQSVETTFDNSSITVDNITTELIVVTQAANKQRTVYRCPKEKREKNFRNVCAYGASRLDTYENDLPKKEDTPILSLFSTKSLLHNIELSLVSWFLSKDIGVNAQKFEKTKQLLEKVLDGIEISVSPTSQRVWYRERRGEEVYEPITFDKLASGYRSMIAMVGDIIIRLFEAQPDIADPAKLEGIVIIDELDLHWHPKWQKKLPQLLTDLFPNVQFIASTHSPIPLFGAPAHAVFLKVNRTAKEGITVSRLIKLEKEIHQLTPNNILTSDIFDFDLFEGLSEKELEQLHEEDDYEQIEKNKEIEERLKNIDPTILPDNLFAKED